MIIDPLYDDPHYPEEEEVMAKSKLKSPKSDDELHRRACAIFGLESEQACIWDHFGQHKHALINDMDKSLEDVNIQMDQDILVYINDNCGYMRSVQEDGSGPGEQMVFLDPSKARLSVTGGSSMSKSFFRNFNPEFPQLHEVDVW